MPEPSRILAVKLSALGDLFHAMPVVHRLKETYGCPIDWVTQPEYVELVRCHRDVDRVLAYPRRGGAGSWRRFVRELRAERYDLAVDLQGLSKSGLVLGLARAGRKIAPSRRRELAGWFAGEHAPSCAASPHALDGLCDTLRYLGIDPEPVEYPLRFPEVESLPGGAPRVGVAPRSRWPAKDWPEERFVEMVERVRRGRAIQVVLLGGADDREATDRMAAEMEAPVVNLCGARTLPELGAVLRQLDVLVCNDSGPMHYAAAAGTPLVALFGPTDPARTGPWGEGHTVLRPAFKEGEYPAHRDYKSGDRRWISGIGVEEVAQAVASRLPQ